MKSKQVFESFGDSSEYNENSHLSHLVNVVNEI